MKKNYRKLMGVMLVGAVLSTHTGLAQENEASQKGNATHVDPYKNRIKMNVTSLAFRNFSFQFEHFVHPRISVALGYRFMPSGQIPQIGFVKDILDNYADLGENKNDIYAVFDASQVSSQAWTPEVRFYFNNKKKGMYAGVFGRWEQYKMSSIFPYTIDGVSNQATIDATFRNVGAGLLLGFQMNVHRRIALDFWIVGPYIGNAKVNVDASDYQVDAEDVAEFKTQFEDITLLKDPYKAKINVGQTASNATITGPVPGARGLGINVVFKF